jgi:hypothetical protein
MMRPVMIAALCLAATPALAETPSVKMLAQAAQAAFAPGSYGAAFTLRAQNAGCFDDEGLWGCAVSVAGQRHVTYEGSVTPAPILELLALLQVGAEVEVSGDAVGDATGARVEAVFSRLLMPM